MKLLFLDPVAGISGDMFLGLLADLGVEPEALEADLARLGLPGWTIDWRREERLGISGLRAEVRIEEQHHHRTWATIDRMLLEAPLAESARDLARRIFRRLGEAEARVHGVPLDAVHFHEVGAVDAIIDITGAAVGLGLLGVEQLVCAPLPLSSGQVATAHGNYPLPAPAVAALLEGAPIRDAGCELELVTPTGAAIAATCSRFGPLPEMNLQRVGYGIGGRKLADRPNLLRGFLGESGDDAGLETDEVAVLETHLDDGNPEWLGALFDRLLAAGALDVALSPLQMKKNRPGNRLTVVAPTGREAALARLILHQSSAIGVRVAKAGRYKLRRRPATVATPLGEIAVKCLYDGAQLLRITPEYESCLAAARRSGLPLPEVYRLAEQAAGALRDQEGAES